MGVTQSNQDVLFPYIYDDNMSCDLFITQLLPLPQFLQQAHNSDMLHVVYQY